MRVNINFWRLALCSLNIIGLAFLLISTDAKAAVTVNLQESGGDVVATASGLLNITAGTTSGLGAGSRNPGIHPNAKTLFFFASTNNVRRFAPTGGVTCAGSLGTGGQNLSTSTAGPSFGVEGTTLLIPIGSAVNDSINIAGTMTFASKTFATLGLTVGASYTCTWASGTESLTIQVVGALPTVTAINPSSGSTTGGTSVTITGTNFTGATAVSIGGTAATSFTVNSSTQITATTPAGTAGTASVVVTTPAGSNVANTLFTYVTPASTDATLSGMTYSSGALTPAFASGTITYTQSVANSVPSITVTPTVNQANATVTVNGTAVATGVASGNINLNVGTNTITTVVTAQNGTTTKTYTTTVTRAAATSTEATLSALTLSSGTLSPIFASGTNSYSASVPNATTSLTVSPTVTDTNSTVKVNGSTVASGSASSGIALSVGTNTITTIVTAQDGTTTQTYTTTVTRAALLAQATLTVSASPNTLNATTTTSSLSTSGGSGSGAVSYVMTSGTCSLSGTTVTAGTANEACTVTATKAADGTYTAATATVAITVSRRATLAAAATDASVAKMQGTQLMQSQKFVQTQMQNIASHLDMFKHNFNLMPSNMGISINTPSLGPVAPVFYKVKDVWSGNSGELTASSLRKVGMKDATLPSTGDKPYNDYNNPDEIDEQAAIEQRNHAYERKQETYSFWSAGTIDTGLFKTGDNKDVTNKFRVNGLTLGLDYKVGPRAIIGAAFGVGQGTNATQGFQSTVKSAQRSYTGYGLLGFGDNWVVDGVLGYSTFSFTGDRTTSDGSATLGMNRTGDSTFASASISKIFSFGSFRVAPFLREDVIQIRLGHYTETGSADYALGYDNARYTATTASAGLHLSNDIYLDRGKLTTYAKLSGNRMSTGSISQDVYYADAGMAGGIYTLQQNSSYQNSRSINLGIMYSNKAGDSFDIGWMGAMGANQNKLNGVRFGMRFAM